MYSILILIDKLEFLDFWAILITESISSFYTYILYTFLIKLFHMRAFFAVRGTYLVPVR